MLVVHSIGNHMDNLTFLLIDIESAIHDYFCRECAYYDFGNTEYEHPECKNCSCSKFIRYVPKEDE